MLAGESWRTRTSGADDPTWSEIVERLYVEHYPASVRFARSRISDPGVAEDLAQEAFTRLSHEAMAGRMPTNPRGWLCTVIANLIVSRARRRAVEERRTADVGPPFGEPLAPDDEAIRRDRVGRINRALATLPAPARDAVVLAAMGYSSREIGRSLGRSDCATRTMLCRARGHLRLQLGPELDFA
jgi:RNA polymerase sigma factor (sigma-70 family)